ncbi:MAG: ankyrin repeat domain-containing protein [Akkermansiaceae bacterium]|nr:ankyrin repeat domain-containing protein [Akkermansiaceae bacterium]
MKLPLFLVPIITCVAPCVYAAVPESVAGYTLVVNLSQAQACDTELYQEAKGPWFDMPMTSLRLRFPANGTNDYTAPHPHNNDQNKWPDVHVSYAANAAENQAYVKVGNGDFESLCILTFKDALSGTAEVFLHEDGQTRHFRHVTFSMGKRRRAEAPLQLPQPYETEGTPSVLDDGLGDILAALEDRKFSSATDKLYQKRLLLLLPLIMESGNPSVTTPETKGNTALHYACALSHVQLAQWLVDHGADLEARTDKGATVDACVSGKNAKLIRTILQNGRAAGNKRPAAGAAGEPYSYVDAAGAELSARSLESLFASDGQMLMQQGWEAHALLYAEQFFSYVVVQKKLPQGVSASGRVGKMALSALRERLTPSQFAERVVAELRNELENRLDAQLESASYFADAQLEIPGIADDVTEIVVTFDPACPAQPDVRVERRKVATHMKPYTLKLHFCGRVSLADGAEATVLLGPEYAHVDIAEPESRFDADIARHFGKHCRLVSYFMGNSCLLLYYTPEGEINEQRTTDAVPQDVYCVPVEFKVKGPSEAGK